MLLHHGFLVCDDQIKMEQNWEPVLHRDIKPKNVFIRRRDEPRQSNGPHSASPLNFSSLILADLGCATLVANGAHKLSTVSGTPAYRAPVRWTG